MSLAVHNRYGVVVANVTATGDLVSVPAGHVCRIHRLTVANANAAARTVTINSTGGGNVAITIVQPTGTIDLDELAYVEPQDKATTVTISGSDVTVRIEYSINPVV